MQDVSVSVAGELERIIQSRIASDKLALPVTAEASAQLAMVLRTPSAPLREIGAIVERDPLICVQILRMANAGGGGDVVDSIADAMGRLGQSRARNVLGTLSTRRLHKSRDPQVTIAFQNIWRQSLMVGLLARDLATLTGAEVGEAAYVAGVLQDIGRMVVAAFLLELERQLESRARRPMPVGTFMGVLDRLGKPIGESAVERWRMPEPVMTSIRSAGEFDVGNRKSAANYVRFSSAYFRASAGLPADGADEAKALVLVGRSMLDLDDEMLDRLTNGLRERATKLMAFPTEVL